MHTDRTEPNFMLTLLNQYAYLQHMDTYTYVRSIPLHTYIYTTTGHQATY